MRIQFFNDSYVQYAWASYLQVTYCLGVVSFGTFCYLLGSSKHHIYPDMHFMCILSEMQLNIVQVFVLLGGHPFRLCNSVAGRICSKCCGMMGWLKWLAGPDAIPKLYCLFFLTVAPLRWIYYRIKKWHYYFLVSISYLCVVTVNDMLISTTIYCSAYFFQYKEELLGVALLTFPIESCMGYVYCNLWREYGG